MKEEFNDEIFDDKFKEEELTLENIRITMAAENYFLNSDEMETLRKCYNNELTADDILKNIKEDINARMVK